MNKRQSAINVGTRRANEELCNGTESGNSTYQEVEGRATYGDECPWEEEQGHQCNYFHGNSLGFGLASNLAHVVGHNFHLLSRFLRLRCKEPVRLGILEVKQAVELTTSASVLVSKRELAA